MSLSPNQTFGLSVLALLQLTSAVFLLYWALPLFGDPPVLGNGIASASRQLQTLAQDQPETFKRVAWVSQHLPWLFARHTEGIFAALGASVALLGSSAVTAFFALEQARHAKLRLSHGT